MSDVLAIGKVIKMPCMRSGVCKYPNESILVTKASLDNLKASAIGIPVIIDHPDQKITDESIKTMPVVGRVADLHYIESEELWYAHFIVDTAEAVQLLENGHGVSTAWYGIKYGESGTYNNTPYDRELIDGKYEHLAIVATPRYEMAVNPIFMNSKDGQNVLSEDNILIEKPKESISMLGKIFKKLTSREEIMVNSNESYVVDVDGKEIDLKDAIAAVSKIGELPMINGEDKVDVDGEQVSINTLVKAYKASKAKKNESEEKDEKDEKKEAKKNESEEKDEKDEKDEKKEAKKNGDLSDEEKKKLEETGEKKQNAVEEKSAEVIEAEARHAAIESAHLNAMTFDPNEYLTINERVQLGKSKYGAK
jgi:hypothetical protein